MNILEPYKAHGLIFREENGKILINFCAWGMKPVDHCKIEIEYKKNLTGL